jgi:class 3 adenylate cyclase
VTRRTQDASGERAAVLQLDAVREVLREISLAPFDLDGVLGVVVERLTKLCHADIGMIYLPSGEGLYRGAAEWGMRSDHIAHEREHPTPVTPGTLVGRVVLADDIVEIADAATDPGYTWKEGQALGNIRTMLGVPIRKEDRLIGVVGLVRHRVQHFSPDEIELARTFADQASIVIENVRLLGTIDQQRKELARYLPSTVAELVSTAEGEQLLAGHRREVTVVSCDLRGFTAFAESAEPEEVLDVLRAYHREMGAIVVAHHATLGDYAGDGMMIFLNDPEMLPDHPVLGVRMALAMRNRFEALATDWRRQTFELGFGVGISVGYATIGRIGFEGHYGYAVIGSVANLAARLCAAAEPGQIVLSERAYTRVEATYQGRALGQLELKGFRRPVAAIELTGPLPRGKSASS